MTNEEFYDREVAPKLMALAKACEARGLSFVAVVEYLPGALGETAAIAADAGIETRVAHWGVRARGNVDAFMMTAQHYAQKHGHASLFLAMAGVPHTPAAPGAG